jgi:RecA-family ATPase
VSDKYDQAAEDAMKQEAVDKASVRFVELERALLDSEQLANIPPPTPLIDGYLFRDSLAWIAGKPGHCKSFAAADMACRIGTGTPWFGHTTKQAKVLYLIAEGIPGFGQRIATWEQYNGLSTKGWVTFLPVPIQFMKDVDVLALAMLLDKYQPDLMIFDTQARVTVGLKENDSTDMGRFVDRLGELRSMYGACLLLVHHEPRNGEHLRGSIAMEGAADSIFRTFKEGLQVTFETTKQKDIEEPDPFDLQLFKTHTSAVLTPLQPGEEALTQIQMLILEKLRDIPSEWVSKTEFKATCDLPDTTFYNNINKLIKKGYVEQPAGRVKKLRYIPDQDRLL